MNNPPKKPQNAFFLYRKDNYDKLKENNEKLSHREIMSMLGD